MDAIHHHWSLVAWMRGLRGVLFTRNCCIGFAGPIPHHRAAANASSLALAHAKAWSR